MTAAEPERWVYVVCIDIKDGWFDIIHAYDNKDAAEAYVAWEREHLGDAIYVSPVPLDSVWESPSGHSPPTRAIKLVPLDEA